MKRSLTLVLLTTICFYSCQKDVLRVYVEEPLRLHSGITPDRTYAFFEPNVDSSIHSIEYEVDETIKNEFIGINKMLSDRPELEERALKEGRFQFAFIYKEDTFYTGYRLKSWSYKNKVGLYEVSEEFKSKFSEYLKWWPY